MNLKRSGVGAVTHRSHAELNSSYRVTDGRLSCPDVSSAFSEKPLSARNGLVQFAGALPKLALGSGTCTLEQMRAISAAARSAQCSEQRPDASGYRHSHGAPERDACRARGHSCATRVSCQATQKREERQ